MTLITHHITIAFLAFLFFVGVFPTGSIAAEDRNLRRHKVRKRDSLHRNPFRTGNVLPPALESECDQYNGKAKRLCVKFCEAKDCDEYDESDAPRGCARIKAKFQKITGKYSLPCEDRCPCWEESELDSVRSASLMMLSSPSRLLLKLLQLSLVSLLCRVFSAAQK